MPASITKRVTRKAVTRLAGVSTATISYFYCPPLTTISYPKEDMTQSALQRIFEMIDSDPVASQPATELLPVYLIVRQSTAPVSDRAS